MFRGIAGPSKRRVVIVVGCCVALAVAPFCLKRAYVSWEIKSARQALSSGDAQQAVVWARKAEAVDSGRAELLFLLGRALRRAGQLADAATYLERAEQAGWPADEVRLQRQLLLVQTGAVSQSEDVLSQALRRGVDDDTAEEIYEARARGFYSSFRLNEALLCLDYWLNWRPQARQARMWRAEIYERTERWREAAGDYRAILEHDPADLEARTRLAGTLLPLNDARAALAEYEKCLAASPDDVAALLGQTKCRRRLGELANAGDRLSALLARDLTPRQRGEVLYELGEIALFNQRYEEAVDCLTQARSADPTNSFVHHPLSIAYARLGKPDLAAEAQRRAEQSLARTQRLAEVTQRVLEDPQDPELRFEAGMLFMAEGLKKDGVAWLKTALDCDPAHQKSHAALAEYYREAGDPASAARHRARVEDHDSGPKGDAPNP